MTVLVTGSSGMIGSALVATLTGAGERVVRLVRSEARGDSEVRWDPERGTLDAKRLDELRPEAVVHLAGESIGGRWTDERKARIRESRVRGTRLLSETIATLSSRPRVMVCASAVGYYGDRGAEPLDEDSAPGATYLAEVTKAWEAAAEPARKAGVRVVNARFGVVLSPDGGALERMLLPFRLGLGGPLASGRQYMSWVALDDVVAATRHALANDALRGPVNVTAPEPVTNREFTSTLGRVLGRPVVLRVPRFALRIALGELAGELAGGQRVAPKRLLSSGYVFRDPELEGALRNMLDKDGRTAGSARSA